MDNEPLRLAWEFVENTGKSVFLTGKAGTGKTTFLRDIVASNKKRHVVVAPTGVAAINAGGVTIHSFFQLPLTPYVPDSRIRERFDFSKEKQKIIRTLDLLIIDEISMVRCDLLDAIDTTLRRLRHSHEPFGGVQLLMIGDLQQLTPVVTPEDEAVIGKYYPSPYFFSSKALERTDYLTIQLEKVYRQEDEAFIDILNNVRAGNMTQEVTDKLNAHYNPMFHPSNEEGYIRLTTHNSIANRLNNDELERIKKPAFHFNADIRGTFPEYAYPTDVDLTLKEGAQVMFIKNGYSSDGNYYYNGKIGIIAELSDKRLVVRCPDGMEFDVEPQTWENNRYSLDEETKEIKSETVGTFTQLPLRLAWAITIHKSQGLTFDRAIIDANLSFAPGQVYVALSRCRSLDGMVLASRIEPRAVINDHRVDDYIMRQDSEAQESIHRLPTLKEEYHRNLVMELFTFDDILFSMQTIERLFQEFLYKQYPALTQEMTLALEALRKDVDIIAARWRGRISVTSYDTLTGESVTDRIRRSADYFHKKLKEILDTPLQDIKTLSIGNKTTAQRMDEAYQTLLLATKSKTYLLERMSRQPFSVTLYLRHKQHSLLDGIKDTETKPKRKRKKK